ncbi:MAG: DNA helicase UvrD [Curvibacter sp. RIFCSPHIGHO2_12_FULL_63_18]|uniref:UvrD-helicase domain-containing protein n=1 Tax=Rhodoferax sp. TaxID=50421 RepID=UPI0008CE4F51|nr:UvrD-helicase domain-containing protein [Rhodoferax sp.]OGO96384.1 MAG: DNA helicase UvrD [Curvibacter sp. GWA2_63_95]OGP07060.1 MAG: DNA helicase UvrD [Curvibacter sp. RIFCSPHIGHO2_12_FULL_63_18]HCX80450.1 DNA helicase UvrD [Rhodoferax sp.]
MSPTLHAAYEHNGRLVEAQRFYEIACDPRRSVAVEACAGAGKTWMLVSRMLRALLEGTQPHEILAITFTKKAAGEMRQRLQEWLREFAHLDDARLQQELQMRGVRQAADAAQLQTLRGLHAQLLAGGRPVQIRTFHSWFAALLGSAPLGVLHHLGLPTQYELLENDAVAVAQVWRRFQTRVAGDAVALADYQDAVRLYGRHQTHKALEAALNKRTEFDLADAQGVVEASVQHFTAQFPAFVGLQAPQERLALASVQTLLWDSARALGQCSGKTCLTAASALERALTDAHWPGVVDALFTKTGGPRKLTDKLADLGSVQAAQALLQEVQQAQLQDQAWQHQQRMARLARGLLQDYAALKRERGWLDMGDLERTALVLLSDPELSGWVQERLDARVRHLLIDEFQDTNPLQWQALHSWLSSYAGAGNAPSVFIVGDPKQSIYRFRRAEPQVFRAAKAFVAQGLGGDQLSCDHTRRNAPEIIALVNQTMGQAQEEGAYQDFRAHSTASDKTGQVFKLPRIEREAKADKEALPPEAVWRDSLSMPRHEAEDTRKTLECRQAAQWLAAQMTAGHYQAKDVMVLARKRERLTLMEQELSALGIPAQQPEKAELGEFAEVQDLVALLDVLVSPRHDLALARVLKSPVFGVSDDDLVALVLRLRALQAASEDGTGKGEVPSWWQTLQASAAHDLPPALANVGPTLLRWQQWVAQLPPHDALSAIYDDGDVLARYAAASPPAQRERVLANVRALLNAALQVDGGRYTTAYGLVRALRAGGNPAPVRANAQAVRLLTIHGAKGLEAPLVLMLDTDGEAGKTETMGVLVDWPGEDPHPRRFVFLASESRPPACVVDALAHEQAERSREELNALYVALTRTQHTLVISSLAPHRENAGSWWRRLEGQAQDAPEAPAAAPTDAVGNGGAEEALAPYALKIVKKVALDPVDTAQVAPEKIAELPTKDISEPTESLESRLGQALHRLLEWVQPAPGGYANRPYTWPPAALARVGKEFVLDAAQAQAAVDKAQAVLQGEGAWIWDSAQLAWHANEVPITQRGRLLRMDRLVQQGSGAWWVLDYKSSAQPQQDAALCAQLLGYRDAVALANPGQAVRAAFLTPQGQLIELTPE